MQQRPVVDAVACSLLGQPPDPPREVVRVPVPLWELRHAQAAACRLLAHALRIIAA